MSTPSPVEALPGPVVARRAGTGLHVSLIGMAGFAAVYALVRQRRSEAVDLAITMKIQTVTHPTVAHVMTAVSWPGFPPQSRVLPPAFMAGLWLLRLRTEATMQLLAWGTAGLSTVIKRFMGRPRPVAGTDLRVVAAEVGGSSFPSGHVLTYVGTYGWLAVLANTLIRPIWPRRVVVTGLGMLVALVGPSRIYQGHHWPTDVAASYLLGFSYLSALIVLYRRVKGGPAAR